MLGLELNNVSKKGRSGIGWLFTILVLTVDILYLTKASNQHIVIPVIDCVN